MAKKVSYTCVVLVLLLVLSVPSMALAFNREIRLQMLADAIEFCPQEIKTQLSESTEALEEGILFASYAKGSMDAASAARVYQTLIQRLRSGPKNDYTTLRSFGVLAGYVSETIYPGHHYRSDVILPLAVLYDGFSQVASPQARIKTYVSVYRPYWNDHREEVSNYLYSVSVNEIVDFWSSAWKEAGLQTGEFSPEKTKIEHAKKALVDPESMQKDNEDEEKEGEEEETDSDMDDQEDLSDQNQS